MHSIGQSMRKLSREERGGERVSSPQHYDGLLDGPTLHDDAFDRDDDALNENIKDFDFKDLDDDADDELRVPDDLFAKFAKDRKGSSGSDDLVKLDADDSDKKETHSPLQNISMEEDDAQHKKDFETTAF